jgi:hypothetical protein
MYIETLKTYVIVLNGNIVIVFDVTVTINFQYPDKESVHVASCRYLNGKDKFRKYLEAKRDSMHVQYEHKVTNIKIRKYQETRIVI